MPLKNLLFMVAGQVCVLGMVASAARPQWFRMNGAVPSRRKIGGLWLILALVCAIGSLASGADPAPTEPAVETVPVDSISIDIAVPADIDSSGTQDASRAAEPEPEAAPRRSVRR